MKTLLQGKPYTPADSTDISKTFAAHGFIPPSKMRKHMTNEHDTYVDIDGERIPVTVEYECDRGEYKPTLVGFFTHDDKDITVSVPENEFDRIYAELCDEVTQRIVAAADFLNDITE